jgi:N-methylhydantoinase A
VEVDIGKVTQETMQDVLENFHKRHEELYTYSERHNAVELVNIESTMVGSVQKPNFAPLIKKGLSIADALIEYRPALFEADGQWIDTAVYSGLKLDVGLEIKGPAVVEEPTTNIVVRPGWKLILEENNCYRLTKIKI